MPHVTHVVSMESYAVRERNNRHADWTSRTPMCPVGKVQQDVMRRTVLKERDVSGGFNIGLISTVARYALNSGYHVLVEGILSAERYTSMLAQLAADHRGTTTFFYLDVSFTETIRRHTTRPQASEFGTDDMRHWYRHRDLLHVPGEQIIPESSTLDTTADRILTEGFGLKQPSPSSVEVRDDRGRA